MSKYARGRFNFVRGGTLGGDSATPVQQQPASAAPPPQTTSWKEYKDDKGRSYYHNSKSGVTQWERPKELDAPPPPPPPAPQPHQDTAGQESSEQSRVYSLESDRQRRLRILGDEALFDEDEDDNGASTATPDKAASGSEPQAKRAKPNESDDDDEDEIDPLDAFMAGVEEQVKEEKKTEGRAKDKPLRADIEEKDEQEEYFEYIKAKKEAAGDEEEDEFEYDEDGNLVVKEKSKKEMELLPPKNHDNEIYLDINKDFYEEHPDIQALSQKDVNDLRARLGVRATGMDVPKPVASFAHFGFDPIMLAVIRKMEFSQPTPIQAQAIPAALSGRDVIGIAKTGSGKTAAYLWPMIIHICDQPELGKGEGPIGVVLAPTRELCTQIASEAKKMAKQYNLRVCAVYGGGSRWEQAKQLKEGAEIVVATPGRLIDLTRDKAMDYHRTSYLVLDEADRMFNLGFEPQVRSILSQIRPDRQTLLFSATFKKRVERLAREALSDPIRVVVGEVGEANRDVEQHVEVMTDPAQKWVWLSRRIVEFMSSGSVLIFSTKKTDTIELADRLKHKGHDVLLLHGDIPQSSRDFIINKFKKQTNGVLIATDVAARGLDIPAVKTVINYDVARDIDTHTHRIGRTGRAGTKGQAFTLILTKEHSFAGLLVRNLEGVGQHVPQELLELAERDPRFKNRRKRGKKGRIGKGARFQHGDHDQEGGAAIAFDYSQQSGQRAYSAGYQQQSTSGGHHASAAAQPNTGVAAMVRQNAQAFAAQLHQHQQPK